MWGGGFNGCGVQDAQCRSAGVKNTQCVFEGAVCSVGYRVLWEWMWGTGFSR